MTGGRRRGGLPLHRQARLDATGPMGQRDAQHACEGRDMAGYDWRPFVEAATACAESSASTAHDANR
ncbi:hypothetical protein WI34_08665 [Burkholderia ubonensis]|nr:hypothetical protein WI31_12815 [Burkholderia ubonensis]KUZ49775.1 hypothetical protein WI33_16990 [Burkholderia ubonensis]KUZ61987.1 hypothetical protein WI34_08665 [Burkholderia ubonensis]